MGLLEAEAVGKTLKSHVSSTWPLPVRIPQVSHHRILLLVTVGLTLCVLLVLDNLGQEKIQEPQSTWVAE